jgi:hypothetical protein
MLYQEKSGNTAVLQQLTTLALTFPAIFESKANAVGTSDDDYEMFDTQPPIYAKVRLDLKRKSGKGDAGRTETEVPKVEEAMKEEDYYEFVQQVKEVSILVASIF